MGQVVRKNKILLTIHPNGREVTIFKANKGVWRMPRHWKAKKDVVSCDKLRVAAYKR